MKPLRGISTLGPVLVVAACSSGGTSAPVPTEATAGTTRAAPTSTETTPTESRPRTTSEATTTSETIATSEAITTSEATSPTGAIAAADIRVCWRATPSEEVGIAFVDATAEFGLVEPLAGMYGHAAAAGDVNRDGWTDLFVGTFADREREDYVARGARGPSPDRLLLGGPDGFDVDDSFPDDRARTSGAVFADLDDDGDDDLIVARNQRGRDGVGGRPSIVYSNTDDGWAERTALAADVGARSVAPADLDLDGVVDLVVAGDRYGAQPTKIYRGTGDLGFDDVTEEWGVPTDFVGLALATIDLDGDGWLDIVMNGDPRVLLGGPGGLTVSEVPELAWELFGDEDDPAGIAVGDLDGDERPDLVLGQHFNSTVDDGARVPVRIMLNESQPGAPALVDVTRRSGSPNLSTKSPHVAIADVDNDGRNDVVTSAASASSLPLVLHQVAPTDGVPRFDTIGAEGNGDYYVTGVTEDIDHDGRVDALMVAWEPERASLLARNESASGSWIEVDTTASSLPVGSEVAVIDPTTGDVLARTWSVSTTGYAAGASGVLHLGLGRSPAELLLRIDDGRAISTATVPADSRVAIGECGG